MSTDIPNSAPYVGTDQLVEFLHRVPYTEGAKMFSVNQLSHLAEQHIKGSQYREDWLATLHQLTEKD